MTTTNDTLKYLIFVDSLKRVFHWSVPCINTPTDIFEVEVVRGEWHYRLTGAGEWIETNPLSILDNLDKNDVNLSFFKQQLRETILSSTSSSYNLFREACDLLGEDTIYTRIEDEYSKED